MPTTAATDKSLQELNEEIYKHSLELAIVNKTLSLLRKLYQISLLTLDPAQLSEKVSDAVRVDLNMEVVGVFLYDKEKDALTPFKFAKSDRFAKALQAQSAELDSAAITPASENEILKKIITEKQSQEFPKLPNIWGSQAKAAALQAISEDSHLATIFFHPLVIQDKVIGLLMLGLNRSYESLNDFERDAITSLVNVVAVALDKALLYEQLEEANKQLLALDKARAEFISIASHQLRTPPATIKWYLGAVLAGDFGKLSEELTAALKRTNVTNEIQIATIDDLLNASRIERGKLEFFFEPGPLEPIVSSLVEQLQPLAQMKKQTIEYRKPSAQLPDIMMDKEKVRQVLNNMIDNAIKYSKQGVIKVALTQAGDYLTVSVTDNGKGIAKDELTSIFEKYTRGHDSVTHATGLGLGMYVAKVIVDQHHGKIWADSEGAGKGATFSFSLPIHSNVQATSVDLAKPA
jgi:signal transduction histidine kinase